MAAPGDAGMIWCASVLVAFVTALVVTRVVERRASAIGLIDLPNARSSHVVPRPRGGGLGILAGTCAGMVCAIASGLTLDAASWVVLAASVPVAAAGLWDDVWSLGVWPRLVVHALAGSVVVVVCGGFERVPLPAPFDVPVGAAGPALALLWIVAVTNFFNFMDGADGLAGGQAVITLAAFAWVAWPDASGLTPVLAAAASAGFLLRNWTPARIFLGDVGSAWLGFVLAAVPFSLAPAGGNVGSTLEQLVLLAGISLALFVLDPVVTLALRWRKGERLTSAHRQHAYQLLIAPGKSHAGPVAAVLVAGVGLTCAALAARGHDAASWLVLGMALAAAAVERAVAHRR